MAEDVELETVAGKKEDVKNSAKDIEVEIAAVKEDGAKVVKLDGRQVLKMRTLGMLNKKEEDAKTGKLDGCRVLKTGAQGSPTCGEAVPAGFQCHLQCQQEQREQWER